MKTLDTILIGEVLSLKSFGLNAGCKCFFLLMFGSACSATALTIPPLPELSFSQFVGSSGDDGVGGFALDADGNTYLAGTTFKQSPSGISSLAFVTKINTRGEVAYTTYFGGSDIDGARAVAADGLGNVIVAGVTRSRDFPVTSGAAQSVLAGGSDVFLAKLNSSGVIFYSTYLGGSSDDQVNGVVVDETGSAYLIGQTSSVDFPTSLGALQRNLGGGIDAFVSKLNGSGTIEYSTFLGGAQTEWGTAIAVDKLGSVYVTGAAAGSLPTTVGSLKPTYAGNDNDAFVARLNPSGSALLYSTYLGFGSNAVGNAIAIGSDGHAFVVGGAASGLPSTFGAIETGKETPNSAFLVAVDPTGASITLSARLGGTRGAGALAVAVDNQNNIVIAGSTGSADFPVSPGAIQTQFVGGPTTALGDSNYDGFVTRLGPSGNLLYSTFFGGFGADYVTGVAIDTRGRIYVAGGTSSLDFPVTGTSVYNGGSFDSFIARIHPDRVTSGNSKRNVIEFYNPDLDHYFLTADSAEQSFVDSGTVGRWLRTGNSFLVAGPDAVCRFYGNTATDPATGKVHGPNSHFFTANQNECSLLKAAFEPNSKSWKFENLDFYAIAASRGLCSAGLVPVYRAYNNKFSSGLDSNHRLAANIGAYRAMLDKGWIGEGVAMCAVQ